MALIRSNGSVRTGARGTKTMPVLGELEAEVMNIVWAYAPVSVKDVAGRLRRERAYNTVQTTLDRLYRKSFLLRDKESHAFVYRPRLTRSEYHGNMTTRLVGELLRKESGSVLAAFVDTAADADISNLERLEELIQTKRKAERGRS